MVTTTTTKMTVMTAMILMVCRPWYFEENTVMKHAEIYFEFW